MATALKECWPQIRPDIRENCVGSMPNRVQAVIEAKGWYTKY